MIAAASLAAALALAAPDPCAPIEVSGTPDPSAAESYHAVGDAERAAGSRDTAAAAYRAALSRDPADSRSRAALALLCAEQARDGAFQRGLRRMEAGDRREAVAAFEEARARGGDRSAALLEGICLYELGEDERARPLLAEAEAEPAHRDAARFFLGLVALRAGRSADAVALLEASASDHRLGPAALDLARLARRDGRVVLSLLFDAAWDSNVDLTPDRSAGVAGQGDASGGATALLRVAPYGDTGPFLRGTAVLRDQARYDALDLGGGGLAAGWQAGRGGAYLLGEASWEYRNLGGAPYLSAPRLLGAARLDAGRGRSAGVAYFARWESFLPASDSGYSGLRHFAEADVTAELGLRASATLAWHGGLDATHDRSLGWWEQGPRALLLLPLGPDARLGLEVAYTWRTYSAYDPALGAVRDDQYADLSAVLEHELGDRWTLRASVAVRKAFSNVPDFEYTRIVPMIGVAYTAGIL